MVSAILWIAGSIFGVFAWGSFELGGEHLAKHQPDVRYFRISGALFVLLMAVCWRFA